MMKRCPRCQRSLPLDRFSKNRSRYDGLQAMCQTCNSAYIAERASTRPTPDVKECTRCKQTKSGAEFTVNKGMPDGLSYRCRQCNNDMAREAYRRRSGEPTCKDCGTSIAENHEFCDECVAERRRQAVRRHYYSDLDRSRERGRVYNSRRDPQRSRMHDKIKRYKRRQVNRVPYTVDDLASRLLMFRGCWMCGAEATTVDHVKPLAKGGWDCLSNIRPACVTCNSSKRADWPVDTKVSAYA